MANAASPALDQLQDRFRALDDVMGRLGETMAGAMSQVTSAVQRMSAGMAQFVQLTSPAAVYQFNLTLRDLQAVIGRMLLPQFQQLTAWVRQLADYLINLSPAAQQFLGNLTLAGGALAAAAVATRAFTFILSSLTPVYNLAAAGLGLLRASFWALLTPMATLRTGLALLRTGMYALLGPAGVVLAIASALVGAMAGPGGLGGMMESLRGIFSQLAEAVRPLVEAVMPLFVSVAKILASVIAVVVKALTPMLTVLARLGSAVLQPVTWLFDRLATFLGKVADAITTLIDAVIDALRSLPGGEFLFGAKQEDRERLSSRNVAILPAQMGNLDALLNTLSVASVMAGKGVKTPEELAQEERERQTKLLGRIADNTGAAADSSEQTARAAGRRV